MVPHPQSVPQSARQDTAEQVPLRDSEQIQNEGSTERMVLSGRTFFQIKCLNGGHDSHHVGWLQAVNGTLYCQSALFVELRVCGLTHSLKLAHKPPNPHLRRVFGNILGHAHSGRK